MSPLYISTALITVLIATAYLYVKNVFAYWKKRKVPYLKPTFPFGSLKKSFTQKMSICEEMEECYNSSNEPFVGIFFMLSPVLLIRDPKIIQDICVSEFSSFYHRGGNGNEDVDPMADNLLLQNGQKWKKNRTKLSPAFTSVKLKGMFDTIISCSSSLDTHIEKFAKSGETVEIRDVFSRFATNAIASVAFGIDIDCIKDPNDEFRQYGKRFFEPTIRNSIRNILTFMLPALGKLLRSRFIDKEVGEFFIEAVRQNLEYREMNNVVRKDFFQLLMQLKNTGSVSEDGDWSTGAEKSGSDFSLNEMSANAYLFFVAGFESMSTTMSFCMYELARNQEVQQKAYEEIVEVLANHNEKLTFESIGEMKFIENCIDETLRMHPPFGMLSRQCTKEYKIPNTDIIIEKGKMVLFSVAALHNNPKYYEEPTKFIPERFNTKNTTSRSFIDMPYFPFGEGPRTCIGSRLAKLQAKTGVVSLLQKFRFELGQQHIGKELKMDPKGHVKIPMGGINLNIKSR